MITWLACSQAGFFHRSRYRIAMTAALKDYPGAKNGAGVAQWLINNIPAHTHYYEIFAGSAALYRIKRPAPRVNHLNDLNPQTVAALKADQQTATATISQADAVALLESPFTPSGIGCFIYLDPPYIKADRRSGAEIYDCELMTVPGHMRLIRAILASTADIMISSGTNELYRHELQEKAGWRRKEFQTRGHRENRTEVIYMNYPEPEYLHEYTYLGDNFTQRQQLLRKRRNMAKMIKELPTYQRHLLIQELLQSDREAVQHFIEDSRR